MIELFRVEAAADEVFGVLSVKGKIVALTQEHLFEALPLGRYVCCRRKASFYGETFVVLTQFGGEEVPFLAAGCASTRAGDILVIPFGGRGDSWRAFRRFMAALVGCNEVALIISDNVEAQSAVEGG